MLIYYILISPIIIFLINKLIENNNLLPSLSGEKHQLFVEKKNIQLSGGLLIALSLIIIIKFQIQIYHIFVLIIFLIGFLSDLKILKSARLRIILQSLIIFLFVVYYDLTLLHIRVFFLDYFLQNKIVSYFFVTFCLLILINGSNFIDGLNGLVLGYYFVILLILQNLFIFDDSILLKENSYIFLVILSYLAIFNFFNKLYLGDGGSYLLGFIFGFFLVSFYKSTPLVSPFFIVLLLWFPCYENLFSILRKNRFNLSPLKSDNKHFHQLLFYFFNKKLNYSNLFINNFSSILINLYHCMVFSIGAIDIFNSRLQVSLILFNIFVYTFLYLKLFKFRFLIKN